MENTNIIIAANSHTQKYFFNPRFSKIPKGVQEELRIIAVKAADSLSCVFCICFNEGKVYFETHEVDEEKDVDSVIKSIVEMHGEVITGLELWHKVIIQKNLDDLL